MKRIIIIIKTIAKICFFLALLCLVITSFLVSYDYPRELILTCLITAAISSFIINCIGETETYASAKKYYKICLWGTAFCLMAYIALITSFLCLQQEMVNRVAKVFLFWAIILALFAFIGQSRLKLIKKIDDEKKN